MARVSLRRWVRGCGLALVLLGAARAFAHEPVLLNSRWATPGARLELEALAASAEDVPGYRLVATGLPSGVVFNVWTKRFGHAFHEVATGFRAEESGRLVSTQGDGPEGPRYLDEMVFEPESRLVSSATTPPFSVLFIGTPPRLPARPGPSWWRP